MFVLLVDFWFCLLLALFVFKVSVATMPWGDKLDVLLPRPCRFVHYHPWTVDNITRGDLALSARNLKHIAKAASVTGAESNG